MSAKTASSGSTSSANSRWMSFIRPAAGNRKTASSEEDSLPTRHSPSLQVSFDLEATKEYPIDSRCDVEALWFSNKELGQSSGDDKEIGALIGSGHITTVDKRGMENSIPELRSLRRKNIFHARVVVMDNQQRCDPEKLAKLYHNKVWQLQKDAHKVGMMDAKAAGIPRCPCPKTSTFFGGAFGALTTT
jgi:hypothetical protein